MARLKKTELIEQTNRYRSLMAEAQNLVVYGSTAKAIECAACALECVDAMMQYAGRYEDATFKSVEAIELILKYAPAILATHALDMVENLLDECPRVAKQTSDDLSKKLAKARQSVKAIHRAFDYLEHEGFSTEDDLSKLMGQPKSDSAFLVSLCVQLEFLSRIESSSDTRLELSTRLNGICKAKCWACGDILEGPKCLFLEESPCCKCGANTSYCLVHEKVTV